MAEFGNESFFSGTNQFNLHSEPFLELISQEPNWFHFYNVTMVLNMPFTTVVAFRNVYGSNSMLVLMQYTKDIGV